MHALEVIIAMNNRRPAPRKCTACGQRVDEPAPVKPEPPVRSTPQARHQARSHGHS